MAPDKFLWDSVLWNFAEFVEVWSLLEINVEAVTETDLLLAVESSWMNSEWVLDLATALIEASEYCLPGLLSKPHALESLLYFFLLSSDFFERVGLSSLFN